MRSLLFSRLNITLLLMRGALALWASLLEWVQSRATSPCPADVGARPGCSTSGGSHKVMLGGQSPPLSCWLSLFWWNPGYSWLTRLQAHIAGSCQAFHPLAPPNPFPKCCSPNCVDFSRRNFNFLKFCVCVQD